ncbi:hypothetical protein NIES4071_37310 [Calothrix sp. NIES-4071]|nr:hypothetical protein NIES4071_37310 [Calothrix sp. NIES-4071]BAZ58048.1 hypothetical protein NIES4105_37240 [Calothrix sp. NIES-4105]
MKLQTLKFTSFTTLIAASVFVSIVAFPSLLLAQTASSRVSAGANPTAGTVKCYGKGANGEELGSGKGAGSCHAYLTKLGCKSISSEHGGKQRCRD